MEQPDDASREPLTYEAAHRVFVALDLEDGDQPGHLPQVEGYTIERQIGSGPGEPPISPGKPTLRPGSP